MARIKSIKLKTLKGRTHRRQNNPKPNIGQPILPVEERIREILVLLNAKPSNHNVEKVKEAITQNTIQLENY